MNLTLSKNIKFHEKNLEMMKMRIIDIERQNIKTKELTENQILEVIRTIIIEEANKNY
ncbi:hypothetical protein LCY76_02300 [Fictibacillus sp. KIGAM418]|uniref:Uncharacterized protein n=1 Tax=Fictibacillus marinisediminis TaxID=2878389 RepID=A0A9X1X7R1_9BACL|nr:hypothetical protein [Fictibacillus marinisediminis]MCK6255456.1 hypothetical protein [Fictibacillus marinisediminis]